MAQLIIRRPNYRPLAYRRARNRYFDDSPARFFNDMRGRTWPANYGFNRLAVDLYETDENFVVEADLPGSNLDDIDISIEENILTIRAEAKHSTEDGDENGSNGHNYHLRERYYGSFERSFALPIAVDADATEATYENGTLTINLPKVEEAKPRRIAVKAS